MCQFSLRSFTKKDIIEWIAGELIAVIGPSNSQHFCTNVWCLIMVGASWLQRFHCVLMKEQLQIWGLNKWWKCGKNKGILHRQALKSFPFTWHQCSEIRWECFFLPENTSVSFSSSITVSPLFRRSLSWWERNPGKEHLFWCDWEQCCEVKCVFWNLTTETTLKCHQTMEAAWVGRRGYGPIVTLFIIALCPQGSEGTSVCPVCGHTFKYVALFPLLLKLMCYNSVIDHI